MTSEREDQGFPVRVDFERILATISSQIYDTPFAFLRENVQNAIDAVRIQAVRDGVASSDDGYRINVKLDGRVCEISDNGVGMTRADLENNFWTMGASGKATAEAKAAGCIGVFGIGGFANFGVCETLEVISRTESCVTGHRTWLSKEDFNAKRFELPEVHYNDSTEPAHRGTIVRGTAKGEFTIPALSKYLKEFVRYVPEAVYMQGELLSQESLPGPSRGLAAVGGRATWHAGETHVEFQLFSDEANTLSVQLFSLKVGTQANRCEGFARLVSGALTVYKRGFRICDVHVASVIGVSGSVDCDMLQPTAGRDSLDSKSGTLLNEVFRIIEAAATKAIIENADLLGSHIRLLSSIVAAGHLENLGVLSIGTLSGQSVTLRQLREAAERGRRVLYTSSGTATSAAEVLQARGHFIAILSRNPQRRTAELQYLQTYCQGKAFDNLIEVIDVYREPDSFERAVLAELDVAVRKLFSPEPFRFVAGKLTMDVPIYWSNEREGDATSVFVDTRHGEFQKLKPLGYSALFWSMIEAFCREYLGETLKRQSPKFFGSGAIDLDAYSKSHAELWELLSSDIETSRIQPPVSAKDVRHARRSSRIEIVRRQDIARLDISRADGVREQAVAESPGTGVGIGELRRPKLLRIVDETGVTGLEGYYLRIPESAASAFDEIIQGLSTFAIVWFANRVTWQVSDLKSTAFLFDVTLDRLIAAKESQGAMELPQTRIQRYNGQIYFFIPELLTPYLVPRTEKDAFKIEVRPELVDLNRARSWMARERD